MRYLTLCLIFTSIRQYCAEERISKIKHCSCEVCGFTLRVKCRTPVKSDIRDCFMQHNQSETLDFQNSSLQGIPDEISILGEMKDLDLSFNKIVDLNFVNLAYTCSRIESLNVDFNNIGVIKNGSLHCFSNLRTLSIKNNSLKYIENNAFNKKLQSFRFLYAQFNDLITFDSSVFSMVKQNTHISANVSFNKIAIFTNSANLSIDDLNPMKSIGILAIRNNFTRLNLTYLFQTFYISNKTKLLNLWNCDFDLRFNPLICDCAMYPMAQVIKQFHNIDPYNPVFSLTCNTPASLRGKTLFAVSDRDFNCTIKEKCPKGCSCTETISIKLITVICGTEYSWSTLPSEIPCFNVVSVQIHDSPLQILESRPYLDKATVLDVSKNKVTAITFHIIPQLDAIRTVLLHENALEYLPKEITLLNFTKLAVLTLSGNPFKCDCHSLWFKNWLVIHKQQIPNQDKIICYSGPAYGKPIIKASDSDFICKHPLSTAEIVAIASGSTCLIFLVIAIIRLNWIRIQVLLIAHFDVRWFRKKVRTTLEYDIFISYSSQDDEIVHREIIPKLENNVPPFILCRNDRDFALGRTIAYNIISRIESSLTTLVVVSNDFLKSDWCKMEFKQAYMKLLKEKKFNLLMIILEDLDTDLMDKEIKHYVNTHVYLTLKDKYFWPKLLQVLPVRQHIQENESATSARGGCPWLERRCHHTDKIIDQDESTPLLK